VESCYLEPTEKGIHIGDFSRYLLDLHTTCILSYYMFGSRGVAINVIVLNPLPIVLPLGAFFARNSKVKQTLKL